MSRLTNNSVISNFGFVV